MRRLLCLLIFTLLAPAFAQQEMEIIPLRHRQVEEILPTLRAMLEPGAVLSGMNDQLILRASRRNREEIKQALAALDSPLRSLVIRVAQRRTAAMDAAGGQIYGGVERDGVRVIAPPAHAGGGGSTNSIEIRRNGVLIGGQATGGEAERTDGLIQSVRVIEGGRAAINVGQSLPLRLRQVTVGPGGAIVAESLVYRDLGQGFFAEPRLSGERVTLNISPRFDLPDAQGRPGVLATQRLSTTISGRLGEWIELGGSEERSATAGGNAFSSARTQTGDSRSIWLRVDEVP